MLGSILQSQTSSVFLGRKAEVELPTEKDPSLPILLSESYLIQRIHAEVTPKWSVLRFTQQQGSHIIFNHAVANSILRQGIIDIARGCS